MLADDDMSAVFHALASEVRRRMLDVLKRSPGITVGELAKGFDVSRVAVIKNLRVLEDADLVISRKVGRTRKLYFNAVPIQLIHDRWTTEYSAFWSTQVTGLKFAAEQASADDKKKTGRNKNDGKQIR